MLIMASIHRLARLVLVKYKDDRKQHQFIEFLRADGGINELEGVLKDLNINLHLLPVDLERAIKQAS